MARSSWHDRFFRGLMRVFPAEFRGDFGDQMRNDFDDQRGVMAAFVFGVGTIDPATYLVACLCLASTALAACLIPARRATRVDPVLALRQE